MKKVNFARSLLWSIAIVLTISAPITITLAQEPAPAASAAKSEASANFIYAVEHDHGIGSSKGELRITDEGIEYHGESKDEARHGRVWRDEDIKRLEIKKTELRVIAYEAASIPIIPRKAPFGGDGKSVLVGSEHEYTFRLRDGEITEDAARMLLARFDRSIATTVIPKDLEESGKPIFEIPVFHRHRRGGESGILRVYDHSVVFDADTEDHSRRWRYSDIRDIGRLGRYKFEIATYEGQIATDGKSYIFDLKRPMTETEYDSLWTRLYERELGFQPALKREVGKHDDNPDENAGPTAKPSTDRPSEQH